MVLMSTSGRLMAKLGRWRSGPGREDVNADLVGQRVLRDDLAKGDSCGSRRPSASRSLRQMCGGLGRRVAWLRKRSTVEKVISRPRVCSGVGEVGGKVRSECYSTGSGGAAAILCGDGSGDSMDPLPACGASTVHLRRSGQLSVSRQVGSHLWHEGSFLLCSGQ
jgi:hypothetical protein